jgi:membrane protease YdiL (CAAX protease family)
VIAQRMSQRNRIGALLRENRLFVVGELVIVVLFQGLQVIRLIPTTVIFLAPLGGLSLWLRGDGWSRIGIHRPSNWWRTVALALVIGVGYQLLSLWLTVPCLQQLTREPLNLSQFDSLAGSVSSLALWLTLSWTLAAFGEEMVYRGCVLNRFVDVATNGNVGRIIGAIGSSALFALGHSYQGLSGIAETFIFGCVLAGSYLAAHRSLWLVVLAHGIANSLTFILIFLGRYP